MNDSFRYFLSLSVLTLTVPVGLRGNVGWRTAVFFWFFSHTNPQNEKWGDWKSC